MSLASRLKSEGHEVYFFCKQLEGAKPESISRMDFQVQLLPKATKPLDSETRSRIQHSAWLRSCPIEDARHTLNILTTMDLSLDWLVIDHYSLDEDWERSLRTRAKRIMVVDDLADRRHDCDLLLDQNYFTNQDKRYQGLLPPGAVQLLGPSYAILRDDFRSELRKTNQAVSGLKRVLVFLGGADPTNESLKVLKAFQDLGQTDLQVDLVVGALNPARAELEQYAKCMPNAHFLYDVPNMAELMSRADLAIGAVGTAAWERCFIGLPSLVISIAENQRIPAIELHGLGVHVYLGESKNVTSQAISKHLRGFLEDSTSLEPMRQKALAVVDGKGVDRIISAMRGMF
jgi:UDP-2,4-diacetamido-2,4,6-trideoxy-beta-L-altropyranose hydrolase